MPAADALPPEVPANLGAAGAALWRRYTTAFEFAEHELTLLETAARQADDVAALEAVLASDGFVVTGAAGQARLNAAATEVRQGRLALAKLVSALAVPAVDEDAEPKSPQHKRAADARWGRVRDLEARRRAAGGME